MRVRAGNCPTTATTVVDTYSVPIPRLPKETATSFTALVRIDVCTSANVPGAWKESVIRRGYGVSELVPEGTPNSATRVREHVLFHFTGASAEEARQQADEAIAALLRDFPDAAKKIEVVVSKIQNTRVVMNSGTPLY